MSWMAAIGLLAAASLGAGDHAEGLKIYAERCAVCHGRAMEGAEEGPPLTGPSFDATWRGKRAALRDRIRRAMPQDQPGSLTGRQAIALAALLLGRSSPGH
jgi:mono/diheme cytochrome c family protein